jgi:4-hydroxybenzoate polyprenyltransferase
MRPYLELCRIYLVPTALADSFAGFALAAAVFNKSEDPLPALLVAVISACLYSSGMVGNDLFDLEKDRHGAPEKPLPSGALPAARAACLASALALLALGLSFLLGETFWPAGVVLLCSLLYNIGAKNIPVLGNILMGACRSGNFLVGATAAAGSFLQVLSSEALLAPAFILGGFITVVTAISRLEDRDHRPPLAFEFSSLAYPLLALPAILAAMNPSSPVNWVANLVLLGFLFRAILEAGKNREHLHPATSYVRNALGALIFLDAALLLAFTPPEESPLLPAAALYLLALFSWWSKRNWLQSGGADT